MDNNISFSKIAATPTLNSWSQAYNAGKLFAVLSLEKTGEFFETESLNMFGKKLLERLEQEFFATEDKNLESIKEVISVAFKNEAEGVAVSFAAGVFLDNILYLFGFGNSKVFIKRDGNFGLLLDSQNMTAEDIASCSGFLNGGDLIVLATEAFSREITKDSLNFSLNDIEPIEITEFLAPEIHKAGNGKISAIVIKYKKSLSDEALRTEEIIDEKNIANEVKEIEQSEEKMKEAISPFGKYFVLLKSKFRKPDIKILATKKLFLALAIIIAGILIFSVFWTVREQNNAKVRALFAEIYPQATKKYEEGQSLVDLNRNFARDSFLFAQKILDNNKDKFPAKSKEAIQTQELLTKVEAGLTQVSPVDESGLDRSTLSITVANGSGVEGTAGKATTILKEFGYNVVSTENADNFNYEGVTIKVKKESSKFMDLLKKDLTKDYAVKSTSSGLSSDSPTSALIIIGK